MNNSMNNHSMDNSMGNSINGMSNSMNNNSMAGSNTVNNSMNAPMGGNPINNMGGNSMNSTMNNGMDPSRSNNAMNSSGRGSGSSGLNGNWQTDRDTPHRREMIQHIVKMLKKDKTGSPEWLNKLPQMAKQLEVSLYRNARSFEAYVDMNTLKQRLQQIAVQVSQKARV